jgi:hypothetical protein
MGLSRPAVRSAGRVMMVRRLRGLCGFSCCGQRGFAGDMRVI